MLNRILLLEGLEHVAGERVSVQDETTVTNYSGWLWIFIVFLIAVIAVLIFGMYKLWKKLERTEARLQQVVGDVKVDGMMVGAYGHEAGRNSSVEEVCGEGAQRLDQSFGLCGR